MRSSKPDLVNRQNGSPHPFQGGGLYAGKVTFVGVGNTVGVRIPALGINLSKVVALNTTEAHKLTVGDSVICAFLDNDNQEMVVIGKMNLALDVFATKVELTAQVAALNLLITNLTARVVALET